MLRQAVRTVLAGAGDRTPSNEAWALVLMAGGVEATKAAGLPARLGCVFHLGRWREQDVVRQLEAWGDALRVRAEPEVAAVVDRAAASLREQLAAEPLPDPAPAEPAPPAAPASPAAAAAPPPLAAEPGNPWAVLPDPPQTRREARGRPSTPTPVPPPVPPARPAPPGGTYVPTAGRGGASPGRRPPRRPAAGPPAAPRPGGGGPQRPQQQRPLPPRGRAPRSNRWVAVAGVAVVVLVCGCSVFGFVADLLSGGG
jgi:hypothetical protein